MYEDIKVTGVIGKPEIARSNRSYQMFFVNKRFIKDKTLQASAEQAFKGLLPIGKFGFLVLNLEMDPKKIDVNVHPTKLEIRFQEEQKVFKAVYHAIREGLLKGDLVKNTEKEQESPIEVNNPKPVQAITMEQTPVAVKTEVNKEKPTIDMGVTQKFEPIIEEPKEEKSSKGTGLFGLFKKKEEIEKNVENNAIEEIFAYKNNGPYIPTEEKKTEEENTKSNLDFEKMYSQTFGVKKEEDNQDAEKVTEYKYADAKNLSVFEEKEEYKNVPAYTYRGAVFSTIVYLPRYNSFDFAIPLSPVVIVSTSSPFSALTVPSGVVMSSAA